MRRSGVDRQHEKLFAGRAGISEEVGFGLDRVRLAANQSHEVAAMPAENRCQTLRFFRCDMFHDRKARPPIAGVNSDSLQPSLAKSPFLAVPTPLAEPNPNE